MRILFYSLILAFFYTPAFAQNDQGWIPLFNGKNLDGWEASTENANSFFVRNGLLIVKGGRAHLYFKGSDEELSVKNFELRMKIKTLNNSNSGVYFHTEYQPSGWPEKGFEAQVNSSHSDPRKTGSLYGIANIYSPGPDVQPYGVKINANKEVLVYRRQAPSKDKEWFNYHITVKDQTITIRVNGKIQTQWTQPQDWSPKGRRISSGTFALQAHDPGCEVHYKDIQLKVLD